MGPAIVILAVIRVQMGLAIPVAMELVAITAHPIVAPTAIAAATEALAQTALPTELAGEPAVGK
tara:strand:- start:543 stop:734 length:192 start_codon:yes stop_codon:yes gene_type:complete